MKALEKKTAAITGAGSGIGRAIAIALAGAGARVAVSDIRPEWAEQVGKEIGTAGGVALTLKLDVGKGLSGTANRFGFPPTAGSTNRSLPRAGPTIKRSFPGF
jgi:NAD(P)-dependent dehydrogenase (short-subunit alcohol dehydrogenase family)